MKKKHKFLMLIIAIFIIVLIPIPVRLKDGWSVEYNAILINIQKYID